jgi:hypothetical protein
MMGCVSKKMFVWGKAEEALSLGRLGVERCYSLQAAKIKTLVAGCSSERSSICLVLPFLTRKKDKGSRSD